MIRLVGCVIGLIAVGSACGIVSGIAARRERFEQVKCQSGLDAIRIELDTERLAIQQVAAGLRVSSGELRANETLIGTLRREINAIVQSHPKGIPPGIYQNYLRTLGSWQSLTTDYQDASQEYAFLYEGYIDRIGRYEGRLHELCARAAPAGLACTVDAVSGIAAEKRAASRG